MLSDMLRRNWAASSAERRVKQVAGCTKTGDERVAAAAPEMAPTAANMSVRLRRRRWVRGKRDRRVGDARQSQSPEECAVSLRHQARGAMARIERAGEIWLHARSIHHLKRQAIVGLPA